MIIDKLASYEVAYGINVGAGATMAVTDSTFSRNGNAVENAEITVAAGGHLTAAGSSFSLDNVSLATGSTLAAGDFTGDIFSTTLTLPVADVPILTNNLSFNAVDITGSVTGSPPVTLNPLGTQTTVGQYYSIPSSLSVASGATLTIGTGATLYIPDQQTLSVSGTLTVTDASVVFNKLTGYNVTYGITINSGQDHDRHQLLLHPQRQRYRDHVDPGRDRRDVQRDRVARSASTAWSSAPARMTR